MKILVIDDSIYMQKLVISSLKKNFPETIIITADNGEDGFNLYQIEKPNYIVTDLLMPGMDGIELVHKIRNFDKEVKIIVITANIQKTVRDEIESLQVSNFINKPFKDEKISQLIETIRSGN